MLFVLCLQAMAFKFIVFCPLCAEAPANGVAEKPEEPLTERREDLQPQSADAQASAAVILMAVGKCFWPSGATGIPLE